MSKRAERSEGFGERLVAFWRQLFGTPPEPTAADLRGARFRLLYERFRETLAVNDATLELIADIEDALSGVAPFSMAAMAERVRRAAMDSFVMVKNLNLIDGGRYADLYEALKRINAAIEAELPSIEETIEGPLVLPLGSIRAADVPLVGPKLATLGEIGARTDLAVPAGFVATAAAYARVMAHNQLWDDVNHLEEVLATRGQSALVQACGGVQARIRAATIPEPVAAAILGAFDALPAGPEGTVAVRSSTLGEDGTLSHAGQYESRLDVRRQQLLEAYREVLASVCSPAAVSYRFAHKVMARDRWMAVGFMTMVAPGAAGIAFSRDFHDRHRDRVVVASTAGLAAAVASGEAGAHDLVVTPGDPHGPLPPWLSEGNLDRVVRAVRALETLFGSPQDVEWAIDGAGDLFILQSRPMHVPADAPAAEFVPPPGATPLLAGARVACRGAASGRVAHVRSEADLDALSAGAVLVTRHSSPALSRVLSQCAAIVTEVGSPAGHMAIVAREAGVPAIVGLRDALARLTPGSVVTVDAWQGAVYAGALPVPAARVVGASAASSPAHQMLARVAKLVVPLHLVDPRSPVFAPASCQSLHDIIRFVHERAFASMFHFGDLAQTDRHNAVQLEARLPFEVLVYDVGGGVAPPAAEALVLRPAQIASAPLQAFLRGLLDPRLQWAQPRPVSALGFLSVVGESMIGPPPEARALGRTSYVVVSDRYMNFSTKAGYHFSTVDTWCGESINKNYVHFRFAGGGAAESRRRRRVAFLVSVLERLDFRATRHDDTLVARLAKYERAEIAARLEDLGRLTICARQLDMLMDSDDSPEQFAAAFAQGRFDVFF